MIKRDERINKNKSDWWKNAVIYQIYPRSFKDSDGDGIGDLKGIEQEVQYLQDIGVDCILLSPIYKSPIADFGYGISDFKSIDNVYGTLDDFISLVKTLKTTGIKITMDFIPNHTSDEHEWFQNSVKKIDPYTDYYVWRDADIIDSGIKAEPNNWQCLFNTSAWTWNEIRGQYYLHQFHIKQPDLNFRNQKLVEEILSTMRFWLDLGVDGFRIDAVGFLFEDEKFLNEPRKPGKDFTLNDMNTYDQYYHSHTMNLNETYSMVSQFREVLDEYTRKDGVSRVMITEAYTTLEDTLKYYGNNKHLGAHLAFNTFLISDLYDQSNAFDFYEVVQKWLDNIPKDAWANWVIGNHDNSRVATRFGSEMVDAMNMLILLLPGTAFTYMGEEIGMEDADIMLDPADQDSLEINENSYYQVLNEDLGSTPYEWNVSKSSGLTFYSNTWLPVYPYNWKSNLYTQKKLSWSHYAVYKRLTALRKTKTIKNGDFKGYILSDWVYVFSRSLANEKIYLVVMNVSAQNESVKLSDLPIDQKTTWIVHTNSINSEYNIGRPMNTNGFMMQPKSALVLYTTPFVSLAELLTTQNRPNI